VTDVKLSPGELSDWLVGQGRHFISSAEVANLLGISVSSVPASLERAREAGKLVSVTKGGWVPVPAQYRTAGAPPPSHFIDQLMAYLGHPYYVGFLSAAAIHGASHQATMVFQVVTPAKLRERKVGRGRLRFIERQATTDRARQQHNVPTGRIWVATPEVTVFDLVESPSEGAGLSNVATVIGELLLDNQLDPATMASISKLYPAAVAQRVGYLIEHMANETGAAFDTEKLRRSLVDVRYRDLSPGDGNGHRDKQWHLVINTEIEHDL
jgi:predicted transcriptional regulator of viral defense system